jgi:hypothetical protein
MFDLDGGPACSTIPEQVDNPLEVTTASFRLTLEALNLLKLMARKVGLPSGGLLEILIRERAKQGQSI